MMKLFLTPNTSYPFLTIPTSPRSKPKPWRSLHFTTHARGPPARDIIIDFGKYKGKMLGTLPSTYLKWVSNNLRARDFEEWANLADQVLADPIYNDRIEWEFAEKLLHGNTTLATDKTDNNVGVVSQLLEISHRFGWDNDDKVGWSKVDFQLLGTSRGGRIPRAAGKKEGNGAELKKEEDDGGDRSKRGERRERMKMKRKMMNNLHGVRFDVGENGVVSKSDESEKVYNRFPGRESLVRKALNLRSDF